MGEARRRAQWHAAHADELAADLTRRRHDFARVEALAAGLEVPDPQPLCPVCFARPDGRGGHVETVMRPDADGGLVCPRCGLPG